MNTLRASSRLFAVCASVFLIAAGGLAATASPAVAQTTWPGRQTVSLNGMWAHVALPTSVTAGDYMLIWVDLEPHDPAPSMRLQNRRVTVDLTTLGQERGVDLYDVVGDGAETLEYYSRVSVYAQPGDVMVRFTASADRGRGGTFELPLRVLTPADADADTLPDVWETAFGLSKTIATGADGPDGDPDGDGRTNLDEYRRRSHPRGLYARYFPEGAGSSFNLYNRSGFFHHTLAMSPSPSDQGILLTRTLDTEGLAEARAGSLDLSPRQAGTEFAQIVESDVPFTANRSMTWPGYSTGAASGYASHASEGASTLSTRWLFAEGVTAPFDTYLLLLNPSTQTATVSVTYIGTEGTSPIVRQHTIGPERRATIAVNADAAGLTSTDTAIIVDSSLPIAAERSTYYHAGGKPWGAGTSSVGAPAASTTWYFAEGLSNSVFDTYLLLLNPGDAPADVSIEVLRADGLPPLVIERTVAARTRRTVHLNSAHPALAGGTSFGFVVRGMNGIPIVAERTMWWDDPVYGTNWVEGHTSMGATETATRWTGGEIWLTNAAGVWADFLLIANPGDTDATVRVTRFASLGSTTTEQTVTVPARSRITHDLSIEVIGILRAGGPILVESLGPSPAPIVAERSMYANASDAFWALGSNVPLAPTPDQNP